MCNRKVSYSLACLKYVRCMGGNVVANTEQRKNKDRVVEPLRRKQLQTAG